MSLTLPANILMQQTANYTGDQNQTNYHVENALLAHLFNYTKTLNTPFQLPANSRVYIYIHYSPCTDCTENTIRRMSWTWLKAGNNPTVTWKMAFGEYYLLPKPKGYQTSIKADAAYAGLPIHPDKLV